MRVALKTNPERLMIAFGIYWAECNGKFQRLHFVDEDYPDSWGLTVCSEDETVVVDPSMDHYMMIKDDRGMDMFVHQAAHTSSEFFSSLLDGGGYDAMNQLYENMRQMKLVLP
ncbi:hypothetical protein [Pseudovibrio sp. WM33]|uniref:hypothetical protein n=1 Tax=Pseudovibrio sp. WM33 TaxID=1735585 RepID=UPI0007AEC42C|nr:hypothetical protein [Pseudovibrio sp. WM33]KZL25877.1 hypothetical protein PsWM33_01608 [Pseudovibrio sp. WM33]